MAHGVLWAEHGMGLAPKIIIGIRGIVRQKGGSFCVCNLGSFTSSLNSGSSNAFSYLLNNGNMPCLNVIQSELSLLWRFGCQWIPNRLPFHVVTVGMSLFETSSNSNGLRQFHIGGFTKERVAFRAMPPCRQNRCVACRLETVTEVWIPNN